MRWEEERGRGEKRGGKVREWEREDKTGRKRRKRKKNRKRKRKEKGKGKGNKKESLLSGSSEASQNYWNS